jgi:hypothetical protein
LEHLVRISDDETIQEYQKGNILPKISSTDYNAPDPEMKLNVVLWLMHYLKDPRPNGFESEQFLPFGFSQVVLGSLDVLLS